jgi:hypothetical protein
MKKKSKIKILKDNQKSDNSFTFVIDDPGLFSTQNVKDSLNSKKTEDNTEMTDVDDLNKIRKKKKVLTNEDVRKASKGLKFNNPSQRNHSSIYE